MIVDFYRYNIDLVLSKLNFDYETRVFSFVYENIKFETLPCSKSDKGPLSFSGVTYGKINESETNFANRLAGALSKDYDCYVEVKCTQTQSNKNVLAYCKGNVVKDSGLDQKLMQKLVSIAEIQGEAKQYNF